jgi:hypothetical protein
MYRQDVYGIVKHYTILDILVKLHQMRKVNRNLDMDIKTFQSNTTKNNWLNDSAKLNNKMT